MGTEQGLMKHLASHMDAAQDGKLMPRPLKVAAEGFGRGTPNHKGLAVACWYVDAVFGQGSIPVARARLLEFLEEQCRGSHMKIGGANEILTASHSQLWMALAGVPLWAAYLTGDTAAAKALQRWWWDQMSLCRLCALPAPRRFLAPVVWAPGARAWIRGKAKGGKPIASNSARDLCYRLVFGLPVPAAKRPLWQEKYNLGPRALAALPPAALESLRPGRDHVPKLAHPLIVERSGPRDFAAYFEALPDALEPALAVTAVSGRTWVGERHRAEPAGSPRS